MRNRADIPIPSHPPFHTFAENWVFSFSIKGVVLGREGGDETVSVGLSESDTPVSRVHR